ncbi:putative ubiquitin-protein ligase [Phaeomoniella chlamydospora]|uniref:HECT-type E3 ubiquitin transferase n=1 Tax=Phaeomoniella chlamydospora TaxID=158046 RepID=A0A0G2E353_PHACM|nr:putative ubiquitin-protein ligase [Phaeomoniella chlamydospora]
MSGTGSSNDPAEGTSRSTAPISSRPRSSRNTSPPAQPLTSRRKKRQSKKESDPDMEEKVAEPSNPLREENEFPPPDEHSDGGADSPEDDDNDDMDDPFGRALFGGGRAATGLQSTLRALSGMMTGMSSRLREILNNLRQKDNPNMQLLALEEFSNLLLISNEDNLSGQFSPDPYVKELVALMQPNEITGEENPEIMLLACRCIANLMEALRGSVANVVYGGAVSVLCQKLLDIQYIDVAEQALITLSKISVDFPASIVREGGLTACLQFLDFFATGTQRTAVTTAANCCRNIPHDSFPVIRDVMPILLNVLSSHDQKVVEQGCLCVTRVIGSFKHRDDKLEELVSPDLLRAILRLLLPGTTNMIGANIHTEFLRVLAIVARASPTLSVELLKMNVVDTLYQILTGVSPPTSNSADLAAKIDSVVIMQALIHRPREQIFETLNVICEILPSAKLEDDFSLEDFDDIGSDVSDAIPVRPSSPDGSSEIRVALLSNCHDETRRFAMILLPTLTDAYSSTVNLSVRQKVLTAQLKMLSNLDTAVIGEALRPVPYASFLASILSQQDHSSLVMLALQAAELLFGRLGSIYQYQFHREGVIAEIKKLADRPVKIEAFETSDLDKAGSSKPKSRLTSSAGDFSSNSGIVDEKIQRRGSANEDDEHEEEDDEDDDENQDDDADDLDDNDSREDDDRDMSRSVTSDSSSGQDYPDPSIVSGLKDLLALKAQDFLRRYETSAGQEMREKARKILDTLQSLALEIENCYLGDGNGEGKDLFVKLSKSFDGDALDSVTSSELLNSDVVRVLVNVFSPTGRIPNGDAKKDFLEAFLGTTVATRRKSTGIKGPITPFSVLISKLQDLLSRAEHFEVLTVNHNAGESNRSNAASMLSKQLRLKLTADEDGDIPRQYRELTVSIHAIATFKALDDYLRPRISLAERPSSGARRREALLARMAAARYQDMAAAGDLSFYGSDPRATPTTPSSTRKPTSTSKPTSRDSNQSASSKTTRNSTRKSSRPGEASSASAPAEPSTEEEGHTLECADERQMSDDDTENQGEETLNTIVDDLEEELSDEEAPDPSAVNMEIAATGRVTARKEDGTRVATPQQPGTPATPSLRPANTAQRSTEQPPPQGGLSLAGRPFSSYAAALAAIPQDWHIQFSIDGKAIPKETTIYGAVHHNRNEPRDSSPRSIWSGIHPVKFQKVKGPPPAESTLKSLFEGSQQKNDGELPVSLAKHPQTSAILSLLKALHDMNANIDDVVDSDRKVHVVSESVSQFINTKLTAKLNRQLEEPLIVASNCLPHWSEDLARFFPFLFPFETRHLFLQSTSFGYSRSMMRWQSAQNENDDRRDRRRDDRPLMGRLQRQKVRISRNRILESAVKVMELYGASPSVLEVEYFEEVGTGLGPTLEFYSAVSKEFSKKKLKLWRENDSSDRDEYAFGKLGLFPAPMSDDQATQESGKRSLHLFKMLGKFVARSMLDSRIIDVSFNPIFFRLANEKSLKASLTLVKSIDHDLANSLSQVNQFAKAKASIEHDVHLSAIEKVQALHAITVHGAHIEDLMLDFTLPGYPAIELIPNGSNIVVTIDNVDKYVERVLDLTLGSGVQKQIKAFQEGFSLVFSYDSLRAFTPSELVMLFGRVEEDWSMETLTDSIKADHGFNMDSKSVKNLLQAMSELDRAQRRDFLQFVTGSPKLPIGGFKSLTPMFTVVCKPSEAPYTSDDYLPSVMTCVNYLKLPDYTNLEILRQRLYTAIREGQGAFHLS